MRLRNKFNPRCCHFWWPAIRGITMWHAARNIENNNVQDWNSFVLRWCWYFESSVCLHKLTWSYSKLFYEEHNITSLNNVCCPISWCLIELCYYFPDNLFVKTECDVAEYIDNHVYAKSSVSKTTPQRYRRHFSMIWKAIINRLFALYEMAGGIYLRALTDNGLHRAPSAVE